MSGTGIDVSPEMSPEATLAHYGVKGMQWGKHKADAGGSSAPSRSERRAMDKAAKREDNLKLTKSNQKAQNPNDQKILDARARINRVNQEYKDAKSTYKVEKKEIGKVAAKRALNEARDVKDLTEAKADELTKAERSVYNSMVIGEAFAAAITRNADNFKTDPFSEFNRKVEAIRTVEKQAAKANR